MFNLPFFKSSNNIKPIVLVVLDGFGIAPPSQGNAITLAKTPNYSKMLSSYPHGELIASGESVGLPANEVGNTEVGHLTLGAGRTILQDLKRINYAIESGTFFDNKAFVAAANHAKTNNSAFHIMGLVSTGNVHSSFNHFLALMQFCKKEGLQRVYLHIFTDGRDAPPKQGIEMIGKVEDQIKLLKIGQIASVAGRYYAMDRDRRWDRTAKVYKALVLGQAIQVQSGEDAVNSAYARGQTDEFIEPTLVAGPNGPIGLIKDNDAVVLFNYRIDRPKQLTMSFVLSNFENLGKFDFGENVQTGKSEKTAKVGKTFNREKTLQNLFFVTMTEYGKGLPVSGIAFGPEVVAMPISLVLEEAGLKQIHMAESEKERFVTYYFDGLREEKSPGEEFRIVPSPKVSTYDKKPGMSLSKLVGEFKNQIRRDIFHFCVINFANPDMVAHTGNLEASIRAIEYVDRYLEELVETVLSKDGTVLITADHGNAEELVTFPAGSFFITTSKGTISTDHSNNPVPLIIVNKKYAGNPIQLLKGTLADVSPTILGLLGIQKPNVMTGRNLLELTNTKAIQNAQDQANHIQLEQEVT
jgi:2,3-bisphosphoglycerate-independent phosphoglycerate mutase